MVISETLNMSEGEVQMVYALVLLGVGIYAMVDRLSSQAMAWASVVLMLVSAHYMLSIW